MPASLKFYSDKGTTESTDPSKIKYVRYEDASSNQYSIDFSNDKLKLGYKPSEGVLAESEINLTTVDTSTFLKKDATETEVTDLLSKITTENKKPITVSELQTKIVDSTVITALGDTFLKKEATETEVTDLLNKITTPDQKPITVSELPTKIVDNTVITALGNTFLKMDATNFDSNKQADFLTRLGTNNVQVAEKIAEKVVSSNPGIATTTALMSVIENHNEDGLVPSYDTLW